MKSAHSENSQEKEGKCPIASNLRTVPREHIPKKALNFDEPIVVKKKFDNTTDRIYGELKPEPMTTETQLIGTGYDPAAKIARIGKKTAALEKEVSTEVITPVDYQASSG